MTTAMSAPYPTWLRKLWCVPLDEWPAEAKRAYLAIVASRIRHDDQYTGTSLCDAPIGTTLDIVWG